MFLFVELFDISEVLIKLLIRFIWVLENYVLCICMVIKIGVYIY